MGLTGTTLIAIHSGIHTVIWWNDPHTNPCGATATHQSTIEESYLAKKWDLIAWNLVKFDAALLTLYYTNCPKMPWVSDSWIFCNRGCQIGRKGLQVNILAWFDRRFKNHRLLTQVGGTHVYQDDTLKTTMTISNIWKLIKYLMIHMLFLYILYSTVRSSNQFRCELIW